MSEAESAPAPTPAAPTDVTPPDNAGRQTLKRPGSAERAERMARAVAAAKGPSAVAVPAPTPVADAPPVELAAALPTEEAAKPPPQSESALALARAQKAQLAAQREAYEAKQRIKDYEAKLKAADEAQSKFKTLNPIDLLKERGFTYEQVTKDLVDEKYKPLTAEQIAVEEANKRSLALEERLSAFEKEREETRVQQLRAQEVSYVAEQIKAAAEQFPLLASVKWAPQQAVEAFYKHVKEHGVQPELNDVLSRMEEAIAADAEPIFASDAYLKALLAKPEQRDRVLSLLGIKQTQPAQQATQRAQATVNSPAAIPQTKAADPGTRKTASKSISPAQRRAAAVAAITAKRG